MARQLTMHVWCDVCLSQSDAYVEAEETPPITIGTLKPRVLALCPDHLKLFTEFKDLLSDLGQMSGDDGPVVERKPKRRVYNPSHPSPLQPPYICKVPGCPSVARGHEFKNQGSMGQHLRGEHGLTVGQYAAQYLGQPDDSETLIPEEDWRCGVVDTETGACPVEYRPADHPGQHRRLIRLHRARAHGIRAKKK